MKGWGAHWVLCAGMLAGCAVDEGIPSNRAPAPARLEKVELLGALTTVPPVPQDGACWHQHTTPAIFETVTEQRIVEPTQSAAEGRAARPATIRVETRQKLVRPRVTGWFEVPCEDARTAGFIASLQRALKARGLYDAPVTGVQDVATQTAVRRYQAARGLDSDVLSLAAARALGLSSTQF